MISSLESLLLLAAFIVLVIAIVIGHVRATAAGALLLWGAIALQHWH